MDRELIIQALDNAYQDQDLRFQVVTEASLLHIYINRKTERIPDYSVLSETIEQAIAALNIPDLEGLWLYSRILGEIEPDWRTYVELISFPTTIGELQQPIEVPKSEPPPEVEAETDKSSEVVEVNSETEVKSDSSTETGQDDAPLSEGFNLSSYCFIRNQGLLSNQLLPPQLKIAKIVRFLHNLPDYAKQETLPLLQEYFKRRKLPDISNLSIGIQKWFGQIKALNEPDTRKAAIWLSRYCREPDSTMSQIQTVFDAEAAEAKAMAEAEAKAKIEALNSPETLNESDVIPLSNNQNLARPSNLLDERNQQTSGLRIKKNILLISIGWIVATLIFVVLGIYSTSSPPGMSSICKQYPGSPSYCRLAVEIVGEKNIKKILTKPQTRSFTPKQEELAAYACQRYANVKAGIPLKDDATQDTPPVSSLGNKVLSNIYVVTVKQNNFRQQGKARIRVGCVYESGKNEKFPILLASDTIPNNWPEEPYQGSKVNLSVQSFGIFSLLIFFGISTIFAAVGISIAAAFGLGIQVNQLQTIYLAAVILSLMESSVVNLPIYSFVTSVALQSLALGITSIFIKGFKINWTLGYKVIAAGAVAVMGTTLVLRWLFYLFLYSLIN